MKNSIEAICFHNELLKERSGFVALGAEAKKKQYFVLKDDLKYYNLFDSS